MASIEAEVLNDVRMSYSRNDKTKDEEQITRKYNEMKTSRLKIVVCGTALLSSLTGIKALGCSCLVSSCLLFLVISSNLTILMPPLVDPEVPPVNIDRKSVV